MPSPRTQSRTSFWVCTLSGVGRGNSGRTATAMEIPAAVTTTPPCVLFEDEHLLVVNKPAGLNTHAPSPFASEGIYDWLRHRELRWSKLAIVHRLAKENSGGNV